MANLDSVFCGRDGGTGFFQVNPDDERDRYTLKVL